MQTIRYAGNNARRFHKRYGFTGPIRIYTYVWGPSGRTVRRAGVTCR